MSDNNNKKYGFCRKMTQWKLQPAIVRNIKITPRKYSEGTSVLKEI